MKQETVTVSYAGRAVTYDRASLADLTPGFAITIHRSQGSEYPFVIIPIHESQGAMLTRELLAECEIQIADLGRVARATAGDA